MTGDYINKDFEYIWSCMLGHIFTRTIDQVKNGDWCFICDLIGGYKRSKKEIFYNYEKIIKNIKLIRERSEEFYENKIDLNDYFNIICNKGHKWKDRIWNLFTYNGKCPYCNKNIEFYNLENARIIARSYGGRCLSKECPNSITPLIWQCEHKHRWKDTLYAIETQKRWCDKCEKEKIN